MTEPVQKLDQSKRFDPLNVVLAHTHFATADCVHGFGKVIPIPRQQTRELITRTLSKLSQDAAHVINALAVVLLEEKGHILLLAILPT